MTKTPTMTAAGVPVADNENSLTAGPRGPVLMADYHLMEKTAHFNRERVPERIVHAKGAGAYGTLKVTANISRLTCARLFSKVGNECQAFVRFSTVAGELGSADTARDPRGFACSIWNAEGERHWVKWQFKRMQGIRCLTQAEATRTAGEDLDRHRRDLFDAVERADFPRWRVMVQVMRRVPRPIQLRQIAQFDRADPSYGEGVARSLGIARPGSRTGCNSWRKPEEGAATATLSSHSSRSSS